MIEKIICSIFVIYQAISRSDSATPAKSSFPSLSETLVSSKYALNRTVSKFKGFEHENYSSKPSDTHTENQYIKHSQHKSPAIKKNIKPKVSQSRIIPQTSINDDTFGSISISGLFHSIIVLLLSLIGTCIFLDYQQRKSKHISLPTTTTNIPTDTPQQQPQQQPQPQPQIVRPLIQNINNNIGVNNIIKPNPLCNTQIILDYDDTLFPTSYTEHIVINGVTSSKLINKTDWFLLHELRNSVYEILVQLIEIFGANNVCIVSNAKLQWLNDSCEIYNGLYDRIRKLITTHKINVISATDQYKSQKTSAFMNILRNKYSINKVISIGDSLQEYNDIETVCNVLRLRRRRIGANIINYYRYKLVDNPSLNTMIKQLNNIKQLNYFNIAKQRYDQSEQYKI